MFKNEEMKEFQYLTAEQMKEIVDAINEGKCEYYCSLGHQWCLKTSTDMILNRNIYRVRTPQEDDTPIRGIPWDMIRDEYQWAAMDSDKGVFLYKTTPKVGEKRWYGADWTGLNGIKLDLDGVEWNTSLTKRPA